MILAFENNISRWKQLLSGLRRELGQYNINAYQPNIYLRQHPIPALERLHNSKKGKTSIKKVQRYNIIKSLYYYYYY
jgi:hypothetical protein